MRSSYKQGLCLCALAWLWRPAVVAAFEIDSIATTGCHEQITLRALERVGWPGGAEAPPLDRRMRLVARDLALRVPGSKANLWRLALSIGVRFNDLRDSETLDLPRLSRLHSDPLRQDEHCLRAPGDDGPAGDRSAIEACRAFIEAQILAAHSFGQVAPPTVGIDLQRTESVPVALAFQGAVNLDLPRYAFRLGRALHALQDGFSHTLRSPDGRRVRHVLNFSDWARGHSYNAARDGVRHLSALDDCQHADALVQRNVVLSTEASAALMQAATSALQDDLSAVRHVLDAYLELEPGCDVRNDWCQAPESSLPAGCQLGDTTVHRLGWAAGGLALLLLGLRWRRRCAGALLVAGMAWLQAPCAQAEQGKWSLTAGAAGAFDNGALAYRIGGRWQARPRWAIGLDVEHNPWFSLETQDAVAGSLNVFVGQHILWWQRARITLHASLYLGTSTLLFDLVSADHGATGLYFGAGMLGVQVRLRPRWTLILDPAEFALPIPQLRGIPFYYSQYRIAVTLAWTPHRRAGHN
ncbi:MAG: hypothetical protein ACPGUV_02150 [Polyangiales bacterium]